MEWSNERTLEFLSLFEKESLIWNPKDPLHKNRNLVSDAWKRIKDNFSEDIAIVDLKKKKDSLMATYRPLAQKVKSSTKTGSGRDEIYKPNWIFYEVMANFLHGIYQPKTTINTEEPDPDDTMSLADDNSTLDEEVIDESDSSSLTSEVVFKPPAAKVSMKRKNTSTAIENCMDNACQIMKGLTEKPLKDDCSVYADLLARKLRKFDEQTREILMHEIDNLIFRTKRGLLNRTQSYSPGLYHQNPPVASVPHNYAMPPYTLHANIPQTSPHYIDSPPELSNSNSSENSYSSQLSSDQNSTSNYQLFNAFLESQDNAPLKPRL